MIFLSDKCVHIAYENLGLFPSCYEFATLCGGSGPCSLTEAIETNKVTRITHGT